MNESMLCNEIKFHMLRKLFYYLRRLQSKIIKCSINTVKRKCINFTQIPQHPSFSIVVWHNCQHRRIHRERVRSYWQRSKPTNRRLLLRRTTPSNRCTINPPLLRWSNGTVSWLSKTLRTHETNIRHASITVLRCVVYT